MLMFCCNKKAKLVMVVILTRKELFMKSKLKKIGVTTLLGVTMFPALAFAGWSQTQYFANFSLGGQKTQYTEFEVTDTSKKYHNNNVTVSNLVHDGDVNNCSFCKLEITGKMVMVKLVKILLTLREQGLMQALIMVKSVLANSAII